MIKPGEIISHKPNNGFQSCKHAPGKLINVTKNNVKYECIVVNSEKKKKITKSSRIYYYTETIINCIGGNMPSG